ncbi:MAG TPA: hypothetical protein VJL58_12095 [Pyrinomonadaceae bacterium]|nr:hypothetical protein [Pyrinomonadaceae bacterium]
MSIETSPWQSDMKRSHLPSTADVIREHFRPGCLDGMVAAIRGLAQKDNWRFPFPELATGQQKAVIWQRNKNHQSYRNSHPSFVRQIVDLCLREGVTPVLIGERHHFQDVIELGEFYNTEFFVQDNTIARQLWFFDMLFRLHRGFAHVGMMSGAMDGPAMFLGHKTIYLAKRCRETRIAKVSEAVKNLICQPITYQDTFQELSSDELAGLKQKLFA